MFKTKEEIKSWLHNYGIKEYTIHDNLVVDVHQKVEIVDTDLKEFPVQFGVADDSFICNCNKLLTLKGSPNTVAKIFDCSVNNLTSFEGCPQIIGGFFVCQDNSIENFKFFPISVGNFIFYQNKKYDFFSHLYTNLDFIWSDGHDYEDIKKTFNAFEIYKELNSSLNEKGFTAKVKI